MKIKCGPQSTPLDRTGVRYGRLTAVLLLPHKFLKSGRATIRWACICDCGSFCSAGAVALATGAKASCGCIRAESTRKNVAKAVVVWRKHGESVKLTPLYRRYKSIRDRLQSKAQTSKPYYKDKGIEMCKEWNDDYLAFKSWAIENGFRPGLTIDRIDNSKGYSPDNCRWATPKEQARNTKANRIIEMDGQRKTIAEWVELNPQINKNTLRARLQSGWDLKDALTLPVRNSLVFKDKIPDKR